MKLAKDIVKLIGGAASSIWGIKVLNMYIGGWESFSTYGGDAYTGIQNASAQAANNIRELANIARTGLGGILLIGGAVLALLSLLDIISISKENASKKANAIVNNQVPNQQTKFVQVVPQQPESRPAVTPQGVKPEQAPASVPVQQAQAPTPVQPEQPKAEVIE